MAFVAVATSFGTAVGLGTGLAATIGGGALIGAGVGGLYSAITGDGDILNSMLTGGIIGGAGAGLAGAAGAGAGSAASLPSSAAAPTANVATVTPAMQAQALEAAAIAEGSPAAGMVGAANTGLPAGTSLPPGATDVAAKTGLTGNQMLGYGLAGSAALSLMGDRKPGSAGAAPDPGQIRPYTYSQTINPKYGLPGEPYYVQSYEAQTPYPAKAGGLMKLAYGGPVERMSAMEQDQGMYPQGMMDKTYYSTPSQRPASMEVIKSDYDTPVNAITGIGPQFAGGGKVAFADGGRPIIDSTNSTTTKDMMGRGGSNVPFSEALRSMGFPVPQAGQVDVAAAAPQVAQAQPNIGVPALDRLMQERAAGTLPPMGGGAGLGGMGNQTMIPQGMYGQSTPTSTGVQRLALAPMNQTYGFNSYSPEGQVEGMYKRYLGRPSEYEGSQFWSGAISRGADPSKIAGGIAMSPEAKQRQAMRQSVADYNNLLAERAVNEYLIQPPPVSTLPGGGERASAADTSKIINEYYLKNLGRQGEQAGLDYWTQRKMGTGESLADINKAIAESPEAQARQAAQKAQAQAQAAQAQAQAQAALEASPAYQQYMNAPLTAENFDAAAYLRAYPEVANPRIWVGTPYQHYLEAKRHGDVRTATKKPFQAATTTPTKTGGIGGYTFDPLTGRYTKTAATSSGLPDLTSLGIDVNNPGFQNFIRQQYAQYEASQSGGGSGGGKAGGLMPSALKYAGGGIANLGSYSDGGRLLKGPGDGMSDNIPAMIGKKQPARLADGEFVVPADVVSHLGNGSTDAGAKRLYAMMDKVRKARTGNKKQGKQIKAEKFIPV